MTKDCLEVIGAKKTRLSCGCLYLGTVGCCPATTFYWDVLSTAVSWRTPTSACLGITLHNSLQKRLTLVCVGRKCVLVAAVRMKKRLISKNEREKKRETARNGEMGRERGRGRRERERDTQGGRLVEREHYMVDVGIFRAQNQN